MTRSVPERYLDVPIPAHIRDQWRSWPAAEWRKQQHRATGRSFPPDERFNVAPPEGICPVHRGLWVDYRDLYFDPVTANRWPGEHGSMFTIVGHDLDRVREERRYEWDEKASEQMRLIEQICLSGRSPQCAPDETAQVVRLPARTARPVADVHLPEEAC